VSEFDLNLKNLSISSQKVGKKQSKTFPHGKGTQITHNIAYPATGKM
jgi:hypothetical protein